MCKKFQTIFKNRFFQPLYASFSFVSLVLMLLLVLFSQVLTAQELQVGQTRVPVTDEELLEDWLLQDLAFDPEQGQKTAAESMEFGTIFTSASSGTQNAVQERALLEKVFQELSDRGADCGELKERLFSSLKDVPGTDPRWKEAYVEACRARRSVRLDSAKKLAPKLVFTKHYNLGGSHYAYTEGVSDAQAERTFIPGSQLCFLSLDADGKYVETVLLDDPHGVIRDPEVTFDGKAVLFAWKKSDRLDDFHLYRMELTEKDGVTQAASLKQLTFGLGWADYEPCSLSNGDILFNSTRCSQIVDCFWTEVSNLYRMDSEGRCMRRLTFDQVHDNYPTLAEDGRAMYTRWDYNDRGQIFPQGLFQMNPDGTAQTALYGNNSWFPTTILHTRPIPGTHGKLLCIFSGHHTRQRGKIGVLNPNKGREEADGATLAAPIRAAEPIHVDAYGQNGEQFCYPLPINETVFFIAYRPNAAGNQNTLDPFSIYVMDLDGRRELLVRDARLSCNQTALLAPKTVAPERPSNVDPTAETGVFYLQDVFYGPGLEGVDRKRVKSLRVAALGFRTVGIGHNNNGGPAGGALSSTPISIGGGAWDPKKVLGEAKIYEDGSACFRVPAKTPLYFQVLDENHHVIQTMRSWSTLQPGETFSCIGCHEDKNTIAARGSSTLAMREGPQELTPFYGPARWFSYEKEIQPILDRHCVRCHDNSEKEPPFASGENELGAETGAGRMTPEMLQPIFPTGSSWSYTTETPGKDWTTRFPVTPNSAEECPKLSPAPFGVTPTHSEHSTPWTSNDIWLTAEVNLPENYVPKPLFLHFFHDEDLEVFINGESVLERKGFITRYAMAQMRRNPLHAGSNLLAVHCRQTEGSQGVDVGLYELNDPKKLEMSPNSEHPFSLLGRGWNDPLAKRTWSESYLNLTNSPKVPRTRAQKSNIVNWIDIQDAPPMLSPYTAGSEKSDLCFMFEGPAPHNGVLLSQEEKDKIACWIDLLVPFCGSYEEHALWEPTDWERNAYYTAKRERSEERDRKNYDAWAAERPEDAVQETENSYRNLIAEASSEPAPEASSLVSSEVSADGTRRTLRFSKPVRIDQIRFKVGNPQNPQDAQSSQESQNLSETDSVMEVQVGSNRRKMDFKTLSVERSESFPAETVSEIQISGGVRFQNCVEIWGIKE